LVYEPKEQTLKRKIDYRQEQLVLRVDAKLREAIDREALDQNRTMSGMCKHILASWLRDREGRRSMTTAAA
jgi:hypothetical protein